MLSNNNRISFKAHPDFNRLRADYEIVASSYFRRGRAYGVPSDKFSDVINSLKYMFEPKMKEAKKVLIAGIGESQEPFSLLAVVKHLLNQRKLKKKIDLNIIDLQSKPESFKLFEQSYVDDISPAYVRDSFVKDKGLKYGFKAYMNYRVKDDIFEFLSKTYNNPNKSYWNSRVQDVIKDMPNDSFDVVSVNNTLGYINDENTIVETIKNIIRILKKDGIFITDPDSPFNKACAGKTNEIYKGIFKKR